MAEEKKKKSIFDKAIDAFSDRDEKAAAEAARKAAEEAAQRKAVEEREEAQRMKTEAVRMRMEADKNKAELDQAKAAAEKARMEAEAAEEELKEQRKAENVRKLKEIEERLQREREAAATVKHVWTKEDTYASLAQKYYGSFKEPYWRLIYDHNKEIIGDHPNNIRVGLEIEIPPLPEELKKK